MKVSGQFKNLLTRGVTYDPGFFAWANFIRDTVAASVLSKGAFIPIYSSGIGLIKQIRKNGVIKGKDGKALKNQDGTDMRYQDLWEEFVLNGGSFGSALLRSEINENALKRLYKELNIPYTKKIDLNIDNKDLNKNSVIKEFSNELIRLLKINSINFEKINKKEKSAYIVISDTTLTIPLEGIVDTKNELKKLNDKLDKENKKLGDIQNKLDNVNFIEKAPLNVKEDFNLKKKNIQLSIEKIKQIINIIK